MDGVLVDTFDAWVAVLDDCRLARGLAPLGPEVVRACWGQGINADCETLFPGEDPRRLAIEYDETFLRRLALVRPEDGVVDTVRAMRRRGVRTAVVTNSPLGLTRRIIDRIGLSEDFDAVAGGDEVDRGKPDPQLVHLALARLGADPSRSVFVGDTPMDREAARAAKVPIVGYRLAGCAARVDRLADLLSLFGLEGSGRS